jgi:hypothetical protein
MEDPGRADGSVPWAPSPTNPVSNAAISSTDRDRITNLEDEIATLRKEVADLKQQLELFRTQSG